MSRLLESVAAKRVLLLNPPGADTSSPDEQDMLTSVEPFGLLRLATHLRARGAEVALVDCLRDPLLEGRVRRHLRKRLRCGDDGEGPHEKDVYHYGLDAALLRRRLESLEPPDLIAVSTVFTWHAETTREAIAVCREVHPRARVVLGGNFATLCPGEARRTGADEVVEGDLPGAEFAHTAIDLAPAPPKRDYLRMIKGCPYHCSYCVTSVLSGGRVASRSPEQVFAELKWKREAFGIRTFTFYDDFVMFQQGRHLDPFLDMVTQEKAGVRLEFPLGFSAHLVDEALAARLRGAGVEQVVLALETTSAARGREMERPQSLEEFRRAVDVLRAHGYQGRDLKAFYLIGLPGQTTEEILGAILWLYELGVTPCLTAYTLTPRSDDMVRLGDLVRDRALDELAPSLWRFAHPGMRVRDLERIYRYFHERFYPISRILDSDTGDEIIRAMQRLAAHG